MHPEKVYFSVSMSFDISNIHTFADSCTLVHYNKNPHWRGSRADSAHQYSVLHSLRPRELTASEAPWL
jgi:hypothetical protein